MNRNACLGRRSAPYMVYFIFGLHCVVFYQHSEAFSGREKTHEVTYPVWLNPVRTKRHAPMDAKHPSKAEVKITAEGMELVLQLQKNEALLAANYQEVWYSPNGQRQFSRPSSTDHCYYHGTVKGVPDSNVVLSTCTGLRGMISMNHSVTYMIEPLSNHSDSDSQGHAVFHIESLKIPKHTCSQQQGEENYANKLEELIAGIAQAHQAGRVRRDVSNNMKYVELMVVADHTEYLKHGGDIEKTKAKIQEAANYVDKFYKPLNIRVALILIEIWNDGDKIDVLDNPFSTLANFLSWRRKQLYQLPNDNAQLVTGKSFQGTTIGLAPLKAMCSDYQSGGINSDHSENAIGVAATMAHEMGHNFGMNHDSESCCQALPEDGGCIMAAATGHPFPRVFNPCNQVELKSYLNSGGGKCLYNLPNTKLMYGGQRCGNGYLEEGEECDCGEVEECSSPCCNANNCTLKEGAECAYGVCCENCKLKSPGVPCRTPSGSCDLPEYCNGKSESCPANFYLVDGSPCAYGKAYCYTGMCLTLEQQCLSLWGKGARTAPDECFTRVNVAGDPYGNCGKDRTGKYKSCTQKNAKCGKIQCQSSASKPTEPNAVPIDTTIHQGQNKVICRGTHVYQPNQNENQGDTLDPGLVMTGTKCGENEICFDGECRNTTFLQADKCNAKCHGHGMCNNNHNCHCDAGWAPPFCKQAGNGGSVDSGPVLRESNLLPLLVIPFLLVLSGLLIFWCIKRRHILKEVFHLPSHRYFIKPVTSDTKASANAQSKPTLHQKKPETEIKASQPSLVAGPCLSPRVVKPPFPSRTTGQGNSISSPSISAGPQPRPNPPSRPPPPRPVIRPSQIKQENLNRLQVSPAVLQKRKQNMMPPSGHLK